MNCPYCGKEMEEGYLQSTRWIMWDTEPPEEGLVSLSDRGFFLARKIFKLNFIKSCYCEGCELLITRLEDRDPKLRK